MDKAPAVVSGRRVVHPFKTGKPGNSLIRGSRFVVLSNDMVNNTSSIKVLNKSMDKGKGISNKSIPSWKKKLLLSPNKYLQNAGSDFCKNTNPLKENMCEGTHVRREAPSGLVMDLDDSDVLRSLHSSVMDSVMLSTDHVIINAGCDNNVLGGKPTADDGRWWPEWDTRTKLKCLQTSVASAKLTERICKALEKYENELPPYNVQKYVMDEYRKWNLVWVGRNKLAPLQPDEVEMHLGFPRNHTRGGGIGRTDRLGTPSKLTNWPTTY
ncbi:hypothetical protein LWI28_022228 [Acer negundo]|uniref:Uncharacterized protein n=1 Tax=Acer negundo TaxID=4023 RepID=A0AAD5JQ83_ACENE|nr:hypothetical protein LWI28_022228 [Acer negundo]